MKSVTVYPRKHNISGKGHFEIGDTHAYIPLLDVYKKMETSDTREQFLVSHLKLICYGVSTAGTKKEQLESNREQAGRAHVRMENRRIRERRWGWI